MTSLATRLDRLANRRPTPALELTPEMRRAWCLQLGIDPNSLLIGSPKSGFLILPPENPD